MKMHTLALAAAAALALSCGRYDAMRTRLVAEADLFDPQRTPVRPEVPGRRNLEVRLPDGNVLRGIVATRADPKANIVYFGGGSELAQAAAVRIAQWGRLCNANVAFVDYRGYGASSGMPSLRTLPGDALPVFDRALELLGGAPTFVMGFGIGSVPATYLAARRPVAGLVLMAPISGLDDDDMYSQKPGRAPWNMISFRPLLRTRPGYEVPDDSKPVLQIRQVNAPLLLIYGEADRTVPPQCSRKVYESAVGDRTLLMVPGAGHDAPSLLEGHGADVLALFMSECTGGGGESGNVIIETIGAID